MASPCQIHSRSRASPWQVQSMCKSSPWQRQGRKANSDGGCICAASLISFRPISYKHLTSLLYLAESDQQSSMFGQNSTKSDQHAAFGISPKFAAGARSLIKEGGLSQTWSLLSPQVPPTHRLSRQDAICTLASMPHTSTLRRPKSRPLFSMSCNIVENSSSQCEPPCGGKGALPTLIFAMRVSEFWKAKSANMYRPWHRTRRKQDSRCGRTAMAKSLPCSGAEATWSSMAASCKHKMSHDMWRVRGSTRSSN